MMIFSLYAFWNRRVLRQAEDPFAAGFQAQ